MVATCCAYECYTFLHPILVEQLLWYVLSRLLMILVSLTSIDLHLFLTMYNRYIKAFVLEFELFPAIQTLPTWSFVGPARLPRTMNSERTRQSNSNWWKRSSGWWDAAFGVRLIISAKGKRHISMIIYDLSMGHFFWYLHRSLLHSLQEILRIKNMLRSNIVTLRLAFG